MVLLGHVSLLWAAGRVLVNIRLLLAGSLEELFGLILLLVLHWALQSKKRIKKKIPHLDDLTPRSQ